MTTDALSVERLRAFSPRMRRATLAAGELATRRGWRNACGAAPPVCHRAVHLPATNPGVHGGSTKAARGFVFFSDAIARACSACAAQTNEEEVTFSPAVLAAIDTYLRPVRAGRAKALMTQRFDAGVEKTIRSPAFEAWGGGAGVGAPVGLGGLATPLRPRWVDGECRGLGRCAGSAHARAKQPPPPPPHTHTRCASASRVPP